MCFNCDSSRNIYLSLIPITLVNPAGTNGVLLLNFERLADILWCPKHEYFLRKNTVVNSASINISSPEYVTYSVSTSYDLARGQSLLIIQRQNHFRNEGNANILINWYFSYGGNNLS
jgi:hypothetical protein